MEIEVSTPISAEAEVKKYTLIGDDIYVKRYTNDTIPAWYRQLISDIIATDVTITDMDAAVDYLSTLPAGYNQSITELQLADTTINTNLTSLVATVGSQSAAIGNLQITKVDATSAAAIALNTIGTYFIDGSAGAWFNNQISTYSSAITANAMNISTLSATVDGHTVSIDTVEEVSMAKSQVIRSATAPTVITHPLLKVGDIWINTATEITQSWNGTVWIDTTSTQGTTAYTWSANASKLITAPDGAVTGWSFGDGTHVQSSFNIYADSFKVVDPNNTSSYLVDFNTTTGKINVNGSFYTYTADGQFYSVLDGGNLSFFKVGSSTPYKYLKHIQTGTAVPTGSTVTLNGFFGSPPSIMVSTNSLATYDPAYSDRMQVQNVGYTALSGSISTGTWTFVPRVELALSSSSNTIGSLPNTKSVDITDLAYNAAETTYTSNSITPTLTTRIDVTSGTMFMEYYRYVPDGTSVTLWSKTMIATLQYSLNGSTWTNANSKTVTADIGYGNTYKIHSGSLAGLTTGTIAAGQYYYRIMFTASPVTDITNFVYNWDETTGTTYFYLGTQSVATYYTTTGTTILQSGYINYIAIGN